MQGSRQRRGWLIVALALAGLIGWAMLYGWTAVAATAPRVVARPASAPQGSVIRVYGLELPVDAMAAVSFQQPGGAVTTPQAVRVGADGRIAVPWLSRAGDPLGTYVARVETAQTGLITGTFSIVQASQAVLSVLPISGTQANSFTFLGAGYTPGARVDLVLSRPDSLVVTTTLRVNSVGGIEETLPGGGLPLGTYTATARGGGQTLAQTQFRVGPLPASCRTTIFNGGFEAEPAFFGWAIFGDPFVANQGAFSGQRVAVLGGYNNALDRVSQSFTLPADTQLAQLSYWRARVPAVTADDDTLRVSLTRTDGTPVRDIETVGAGSAANVWEQTEATLAYPGQTLRLNFTATTNSQNPAAFGVDEVALVACSQAPVVDLGPPDPTVRPVPVPASTVIGERVRVDVWMENVESLYSADVTLGFDPTILRGVTTQVMPGPFLHLPGSAVITRNEVNNTLGTARLAVSRLAPAPAVTGSGVLFTLEFESLAAGTSALTMTNALAATPGGGAIPLERATSSVKVRTPQGTLNGRVELQGRASYDGVTVRLAGPSPMVLTTGASGDYRFEGLAPGDYVLSTRRQGWLCAERAVSVAGGAVIEVPTVRLVAGDVNASDLVDLFDLVIIAYAYDSPASAEPRADLNGNGWVDIGDLVLVATNYGRACPQPWSFALGKRGASGQDPGAKPGLSLVARTTADGYTTVEMWATDAAEARALDLTLNVDTKRTQVVGESPFAVAGALRQAFVARNALNGDTARLAAALLPGAEGLKQRTLVATLTIKGDATGISVQAATWVDAEGDAIGGAKVAPAAAIRGVEKSPALTPTPEVKPAIPRWLRPAAPFRR